MYDIASIFLQDRMRNQSLIDTSKTKYQCYTYLNYVNVVEKLIYRYWHVLIKLLLLTGIRSRKITSEIKLICNRYNGRSLLNQLQIQ